MCGHCLHADPNRPNTSKTQAHTCKTPIHMPCTYMHIYTHALLLKHIFIKQWETWDIDQVLNMRK